jgi:sulfate transport system substrate-binding protein
MMFAALILGGGCNPAKGSSEKQAAVSELTLLNVSYDPTRELYDAFDAAFSAHWLKETGQKLNIKQSHGGSGKQARSVIDGLEADVVTLALAYDIDAIAKAGSLAADWQSRLPDRAPPTPRPSSSWCAPAIRRASRTGRTLVKPGVAVITPNPRPRAGRAGTTSPPGAHGLAAGGGDEAKAKAFVAALFANVPVLDSGARGATTTFVERGIGDVFLAWENEALLVTRQIARASSRSSCRRSRSSPSPRSPSSTRWSTGAAPRAAAQAYLEFLYSPTGQELVAEHFYRPRLAAVAEKHKTTFRDTGWSTVDEAFGGWTKAQATHSPTAGPSTRSTRWGKCHARDHR